MRTLSDLIEYENENSSIDFKAIQYKKEQNGSFLKDIIALANAITKEDKYIIIGVKHFPDGSREKLGITENFIDDAIYQQLVDANIEPSIGFRYLPFELDGKTYGIFQITNCSNPPYMMKKDFDNLRLGDSFIRKGSFQSRLSRKDLDALNNSFKNVDISNEVDISLKENQIIYYENVDEVKLELPSAILIKKIEEIIFKKERELEENQFSPSRKFRTLSNLSNWGDYENRELPELRKDLESLKIGNHGKDDYYLNETTAHKLNFFIHNNSSTFLEDASIEILLPKSDKYFVRDSIYTQNSNYPLFSPQIASSEEINYPSVEDKGDYYRVYEEIGNIKHHLPIKGFKVDLRLVFFETGNNIDFKVKIFAKNIIRPIIKTLVISN